MVRGGSAEIVEDWEREKGLETRKERKTCNDPVCWVCFFLKNTNLKTRERPLSVLGETEKREQPRGCSKRDHIAACGHGRLAWLGEVLKGIFCACLVVCFIHALWKTNMCMRTEFLLFVLTQRCCISTLVDCLGVGYIASVGYIDKA